MHNYIEFFQDLISKMNVPVWVIVLMAGFGLMQGIGEFLEFKGRIVPDCMKIRKWFARRRKEKCAISEMTELMPSLKRMPETLEKTTALLESVDGHYSKDNITMRDNWMMGVNNNIDEIHRWMQEMTAKLDKNSEDTLEIRIENMRSTVIDFAAYVGKEENPVTKEQFNRVFKLYDKYEALLVANNRTNGEVDVAIGIIKDSYAKHLLEHTFIEDLWNV